MTRFYRSAPLTLALAAALAAGCGHAPPARPAGPAAGPMHAANAGERIVVRLRFADAAQLARLARAGVDLFEDVDHERRTVGATLTPATQAVVQRLGVAYEVVARATAERVPSGYMTVAQVDAELASLAARHPAIARRVLIGASIEGRPIHALQITSRPGQGLPAIRVGAGQHARELPPVELAMRLARKLTDGYEADAQVKTLVDTRDIWIVPVSNPDGRLRVEGGDGWWRKNARKLARGVGVDTNRNFDDHWEGGNDDPGADDYHGAAPFSEPESQAIRDLCAKVRFRVSVDVHNYGGMVLWPPGYDRSVTKDEATFQRLGRQLGGRIGYKYGTIARTIYETHGDLATWEYDTYGTLAFAAELNDRSFAVPIAQAERDWAEWAPNFMYLIDAAGNPAAAAPALVPGLPALAAGMPG